MASIAPALRYGSAFAAILFYSTYALRPAWADDPPPRFCPNGLLTKALGLDPKLRYQVRKRGVYCDGTTERLDAWPKKVVGIVHACPRPATKESLAERKQLTFTWPKMDLPAPARVLVTSTVTDAAYRLDAESPLAAGAFQWDPGIIAQLGTPERRIKLEELQPLVLVDAKATRLDKDNPSPDPPRQVHVPVRWNDSTPGCHDVYLITLTGQPGRVVDAVVRLTRVSPPLPVPTKPPVKPDAGPVVESEFTFPNLFADQFATIVLSDDRFPTPGIYQMDLHTISKERPPKVIDDYVPIYFTHGPLELPR